MYRTTTNAHDHQHQHKAATTQRHEKAQTKVYAVVWALGRFIFLLILFTNIILYFFDDIAAQEHNLGPT